MGRIFPEEWARFRDGVPADQRDGNLALAYSRLLHDPDPVVRDKAARDWCDWEDTHVRTHPGWKPDPRYDDPAFRLRFARLVTHYWGHAAWLDEGVLVREAGRLAGIPGVLIHGRLDISSPADIAWRMAQAWPDSELHLVEQEGHGAGGRGTNELILAALDRFTQTAKI
jgi:proline iminopeptidase